MWDWAIWTALILAMSAGIAAFALLVSRSLNVLRAFNETRKAVVRALDSFAARAEAAADRLADAEETAELQDSLARLRVSLARLAVLRAAIGEEEETLGWATGIVPRK